MRSSLHDLLPDVLRADPAMRDFLRAFEKVLLGRPDFGSAPVSEQLPFNDDDLTTLQGLEEVLDALPNHFSPWVSTAGGKLDAASSAPDEFLPWLSQWVALSLRTDIFQSDANTTQAAAAEQNRQRRRQFISQMAELYRYRGTKRSLIGLLAIFTGSRPDEITIQDQVDGQPFFFKVLLPLERLKTGSNRASFERIKELAHSVIRLEKPAHTRDLLVPAVRTIQIGRGWPSDPNRTPYNIQVGVNTRLGSKP